MLTLLAEIEDAPIGTLPDGSLLRIDARLGPCTHKVGTWETIEHEIVTETPTCLSISGAVYQTRRSRDPYWAGQCIGALRQVIEGGRLMGWSEDRAKALLGFWQDWHLNDMIAGCAHQTVVYEPGHPEDRLRPDLKRTPPCPKTGYRYGTSWLLKPISTEKAREIAEVLRGGL